MRRLFVSALVAIALLVFAAPSAFAFRIVFDPTPDANPPAAVANDPVCDGLTVATSNQPCNIQNFNAVYTVTWLSCSKLPSGVNTTGFNYCLWLNNVSGFAVSTFTFDLTLPTSLAGQTLACSGETSQPATVITSDCPTALSSIFNGSLDLTFTSTPPLANNTDYYLLTDLANMPDPAGVTQVPEPGELGLFGLGLLVIGVAGYAAKRRRGSRTKTRT